VLSIVVRSPSGMRTTSIGVPTQPSERMLSVMAPAPVTECWLNRIAAGSRLTGAATNGAEAGAPPPVGGRTFVGFPSVPCMSCRSCAMRSMRPPSRRINGVSRATLFLSATTNRPIRADQAATSVDTCSITHGVARPSDNTSSPAYSIARDTTVATASRTSVRTPAVRYATPSVIEAIVSAPLARPPRTVRCLADHES